LYHDPFSKNRIKIKNKRKRKKNRAIKQNNKISSEQTENFRKIQPDFANFGFSIGCVSG